MKSFSHNRGKAGRKVHRSGTGTSEHAAGESGMVLRWTKRAFLGLGVLVLALAGAGATYQTVATEIDERRYPPPGQLVDAGGHRLHLNVMGEDEDGPAVILESGLGMASPYWGRVQPEVADFARVVSYDRAGTGWSEGSEQPHDPEHAARQLHAALEEAGIEGPYVLVGHSLGGLYARTFAGLYPAEVAGMVLVDSSHPDQVARLEGAAEAQRASEWQEKVIPPLARLGLMRLTVASYSQAGGLPPQQRQEAEALLSSARHAAAASAEGAAWEAQAAQARDAGDLGDKPLVVLTAGKSAVPAWHPLQAELATLSSKGTRLVSEEADHISVITDREHYRAAVNAVGEVVEDAR